MSLGLLYKKWLIPVSVLTFLLLPPEKAISVCHSDQLVPIMWTFRPSDLPAFFVITFTTPPKASLPNRVEAGPFTTSILSIIEFGIPNNPYTVERLLTIGIPSIRTIV